MSHVQVDRISLFLLDAFSTGLSHPWLNSAAREPVLAGR